MQRHVSLCFNLQCLPRFSISGSHYSGGSRGGSMGSMEPSPLLKGWLRKYYVQTYYVHYAHTGATQFIILIIFYNKMYNLIPWALLSCSFLHLCMNSSAGEAMFLNDCTIPCHYIIWHVNMSQNYSGFSRLHQRRLQEKPIRLNCES